MITWIAGYPKSGNTWIRLFLRAYDDPEKFHIEKGVARHKLQDSSNYYLQRVSPVPIEELTGGELLALRGAVLVAMIRDFGNPCIKTHALCGDLGVITSTIPLTLTERAIYLIRDPRDVVFSYAAHYGLSIDEAISAMANKENMTTFSNDDLRPRQPLSSWSVNVQSWTRPLPFDQFTIRYEYLLGRPRDILRAVVDFMKLDYDASRFDQAVELTTFRNLQALESQSETVSMRPDRMEKYFRSGRAGEWRDKLTPDQIARIEADHGEVMMEWKYLAREAA